MDKIWLAHYPPGTPAEIDPSQYRSLVDVLKRSCERFGDKPAFTNMGVSMSFRELDERSRAFGAYLQRTLGFEKGDRIAIMMPNVLQYPVVLFGALRAGSTVVNVNPLYTPRELEHQLQDSGARAIVVLENFAHTVAEVAPKTRIEQVITTQLGDLFPAMKSLVVNLVVKYVKHLVPQWHIATAVDLRNTLRSGRGERLIEPALSHEDIAFLQYTGGTTGVAKGAMLTHGNLVANLLQVSAWIGGNLEEGAETIITPLPLYHVFSLTANLLTFLHWGANNVLITNPRDIPGLIAELKKMRFTAITGVNTLFNALLNAPGIRELDTSALKLAVGGGMAVQRAVAEKWQQVFGIPLLEGYGLTETSPVACINPLDAKEFSGKIGLPIPSTEVSIRDEAGNEVPLGTVGEICIRGPQVMKGYWNRPAQTEEAMLAGGWFRSGDMGDIDERGYVRVTDRKKDMIVVSGFNVYPNEVEDVAALHPGVLESAAIGVADPKSGETVDLVVVRKDPALTAEALIAHCRQHLAGYKVPKHVSFRDTPLPKSPIGKVLRRVVRDEARGALASA
ncbi:MAG: AMP-binding protein [Burkholderiales bacterium]|nr:AMP-binding protein [Burkholderiales bacterium]